MASLRCPNCKCGLTIPDGIKDKWICENCGYVENPSRVFILQQPKAHMDLSSCDKYGERVTLFVNNERRPSVFDTEEFGNAVLDKLESHNFDPAVDYICVTGAMVAVITGIIAISSVYEEFMILLFSSNSAQYVAKKVGFSIWGPCEEGPPEEREETMPCGCTGTCKGHGASWAVVRSDRKG